jgi:hypothetical protein
MAGRVATGADLGDTAQASGWPAVAGDLCFVATGEIGGIHGWLPARWRLPPVEATAGLAPCGGLAFVPVRFVVRGVPEAAPAAPLHPVAVSVRGVHGPVIVQGHESAARIHANIRLGACSPALRPAGFSRPPSRARRWNRSSRRNCPIRRRIRPVGPSSRRSRRRAMR